MKKNLIVSQQEPKKIEIPGERKKIQGRKEKKRARRNGPGAKSIAKRGLSLLGGGKTAATRTRAKQRKP